MRWRISNLAISYAVGELLIVTAGVLLAFGINGWNSRRIDRVEEGQAIERLIADLREDHERLQNQAGAIDEKERSLLRLRDDFARHSVESTDARRFLKDVVIGADYGWNQVEARRTTFGELLSSGRFGLIRDAQLRESINEYYDFDASVHGRIDARETQFPRLSYALVPREDEGLIEGVRGLAEIDSALSAADLDALTERVLNSEIGTELIGELNLARYIRNVGQRVGDRCSALIAALEQYRDAAN
jgi:hypothetical protein